MRFAQSLTLLLATTSVPTAMTATPSPLSGRVGGVGGGRGRPWGSIPGLSWGRSNSRPVSTTALHQHHHPQPINTAATAPLGGAVPRGGASEQTTAEATTAEDATSADFAEDGEQQPTEESLDEKVAAAMRKLGLDPDSGGGTGGGGGAVVDGEDDQQCEDGVCEVPAASASAVDDDPPTVEAAREEEEEDVNAIANRISEEMQVDRQIVLAAIGATAQGGSDDRRVDEEAARSLIQAELDAIGGVGEECDEVKQLISEGHSPFLSRRALAFAEMNVDDARAILLADMEDEEEERQVAEEEEARAKVREEDRVKKEKEEAESNFREVNVDAGFDPTAPASGAADMEAGAAGLGLGRPAAPKPPGAPKEAKKADVVFDITTDQIQEIVVESPVPVLLDVYADWCGPCKALTPALEQMAVKAGGVFRLVKINSDNERSASQALEVKALPSVFAVRDGKIVNTFQGMPRDEEFMRDFMMGLLLPGGEFKPPVTPEQKKDFAALSTKMLKVAGAASFPFSARERLQDRTVSRLDELVTAYGGNMADAEDSARTIRSLLSNVIRDPFEPKFRRVNLENRVIASRVGAFPPAVSILKSVGFVAEGGDGGAKAMSVGKGKKAVNVAPLVVARDCIDKWIDKNRYEIAKAARARKDEIERDRLAAEAEAAGDEDEYDSEEEEDVIEVDPNACSIKLRVEGKKKVHDLAMRADDTLNDLIGRLPSKVEEDEEVQITCTAKRLIVKSTDDDAMGKTLRQHKLMPAASVVVKVGKGGNSPVSAGKNSNSMAERAAARQAKKGGSHTMQSIGIYSKDDNAKGELIDGGGGVWYEHDVTSDDEAEAEVEDEASKDEDAGLASGEESASEDESADA